LLDTFGGLDARRDVAAAAFQTMRSEGEALADARRSKADRQSRQELLAFQSGELDRAGLTSSNEDEELASARRVLTSAERIERLCREGYSLLYDSDTAVLAQLGALWRRVNELATLDPRFQSYLDARETIKPQLEDLALFLRQYADLIDASPARLAQVEERLALIERLKRKYGPTLADVINHHARMRREVQDLERTEELIADALHAYEHARTAFLDAGRALSDARHHAAGQFARSVERLLAELAMDRTRMEVRFNPEPLAEGEWTSRGIDAAEFFLSPNPGEDLKPLSRIASGGELSRIMLAVKTLTAAARHGMSDADDRRPGAEAPGIIFDEVDAGIGGRTADVVGRKLRALGSAFQVLCITHLPQIAAYADAHYSIEKHVDGGRTHTRVVRVDGASRVEELARMLGGDAVTAGIRASAREMLRGRRDPATGGAKGESNTKDESESSRPRRQTQGGETRRRE